MSAALEFTDHPWSWKHDRLYDFVYKYNNMPPAYRDFFTRPKIVSIMETLSDFLYSEGQTMTIYPPMNQVFRAMQTENPTVVILGLNPYHNGSACGLSFSIPPGATYINPSMQSIKKEVSDCGFKVESDSGDLSRWAEQGVLLLNTGLTVLKGDANSHLAEWSDFTTELITYLSKTYVLAWLLWGKDAQAYTGKIYRKAEQYIIPTSHPMPLAAHISFFGSRCFSKVNEWLSTQESRKQIIWNIP